MVIALHEMKEKFFLNLLPVLCLPVRRPFCPPIECASWR